LYVGNSWRKFLATFVQKITMGTMMSSKVITSNLASGPNISLPLMKKICMMNSIIKRRKIQESMEKELINLYT
jgi:hypothetical protein